MRELFASDAGRLPKHTLEAAGLVLDASKNRVDDATLSALLSVARARAGGRSAARRDGTPASGST